MSLSYPIWIITLFNPTRNVIRFFLSSLYPHKTYEHQHQSLIHIVYDCERKPIETKITTNSIPHHLFFCVSKNTFFERVTSLFLSHLLHIFFSWFPKCGPISIRIHKHLRKSHCNIVWTFQFDLRDKPKTHKNIQLKKSYFDQGGLRPI